MGAQRPPTGPWPPTAQSHSTTSLRASRYPSHRPARHVSLTVLTNPTAPLANYIANPRPPAATCTGRVFSSRRSAQWASCTSPRTRTTPRSFTLSLLPAPCACPLKPRTQPRAARLFPPPLPAPRSIAAVAYMMMALQEGAQLAPNGQHVVLWVRSLDYVLATPLLLLDLGLLAGAQADELFLIIISDMLMIATGYWCGRARHWAPRLALAARADFPALPPLAVAGRPWPSRRCQSGACFTFQWSPSCPSSTFSSCPCRPTRSSRSTQRVRRRAAARRAQARRALQLTPLCPPPRPGSAQALQLPRGLDCRAVELLLGRVAAL